MASEPVAIVTGAAQGIGFAVTERLLQEGYKVCLADVNKERGHESLYQLQKKYCKDKLLYEECDVSSQDSFQETFKNVLRTFGRIDLLVNNAGIADEYDPQRTIAINLVGPIIGCQLALKFMGTSNGGKGGIVINVASVAGLYPVANLPVYAATKHGVVGLTRSYGNNYHLKQNGITFMAICPSRVETSFMNTAKPQNVAWDPWVLDIMRPELVAEGILKLLKDRVNGSTLLATPANFSYVGLPDELQKRAA